MGNWASRPKTNSAPDQLGPRPTRSPQTRPLNSLDPHQAGRNVGLDLDPNCLTITDSIPEWFFFLKRWFWKKKKQQTTKRMKNTQHAKSYIHCKVNRGFIVGGWTRAILFEGLCHMLNRRCVGQLYNKWHSGRGSETPITLGTNFWLNLWHLHVQRIIDGLGLIRLFFWFPECCFWAYSVVHVVSVQRVNLIARAS